MMNDMMFFMLMIPPTITQQEHKVTVHNGKPRFYEPAELKAARQKLTDHLAQHVPPKPYKDGVRLVVKWIWPCGENHVSGAYKLTKPDTDNLQKMLKDCMTRLHYWKDDALVASEICEKFYGDYPGIFISIQELKK